MAEASLRSPSSTESSSSFPQASQDHSHTSLPDQSLAYIAPFEELAEDLDEESLDLPGIQELDTRNTIHDRSQFQSKFEYELRQHDETGKQHYEIDVWLFIPRTMGINSGSYKREQFYNDLTNYIRLRTPDLPDWLQVRPRDFVIPSADRYFDPRMTIQEREQAAQAVIQDVKFLGCLFNTRFKQLRFRLKQALRSPASEAVMTARLRIFRRELQLVEARLARYRSRYIRRAEDFSYLLSPPVRRVFQLVNEYVSYQLELMLIKLHDRLARFDISADELRTQIVDHLKQEHKYRKKHILPHLERVSDLERRLETQHHRTGLLKKYVYNILYLEQYNVTRDRTYRNVIAAVGAALAASWAAVANFQQMQMASRGDADLRLLLLFILGVLAYVLKDRIKDLSKEYFNARFRHVLPDQENELRYEYANSAGHTQQQHVGQSQQVMRFRKVADVSPEILYIRDIGQQSHLSPERAEHVLHYTKKTTFPSQDLSTALGPIRQVKDIVRLDLSEFVRKLSDPSQQLRYYDPAVGIMSIEAPKVYHINVVFRYTMLQEHGEGEEATRHTEYERVRLLLNKTGIVGLEEVLPRGELHTQESGPLDALKR